MDKRDDIKGIIYDYKFHEMNPGEAIDRILALLPEWISVEDRLPEEGIEVLTIDKDGGRETGFYRTGWSSCDGTIVFCQVTHWQPLPQPPKEA